MPVRTLHKEQEDWFITFTCFEWIPLFQITNGYHLVYDWFRYLHKKNKAEVVSYVIMPNHFHAILHLHSSSIDLNKLVGNGKRFIAYGLVKLLEEKSEMPILYKLAQGVTDAETKKGQKHRVFANSFDAKSLETEKFLYQKLDYIHHNPVQGKWKLAEEYTDYEHSSASFYELGVVKHFEPKHFRDIWYAE
jgi:REP element-mobilizing transposase RayT